MTLAESYCGFFEKPRVNFLKKYSKRERKEKVVLFAHPWWKIGGAENVLLNWIKMTKNTGNVKVIDVVESSWQENESLKRSFKNFANEQYSLENIASTPLQKLKFCWNLISKERPDVLFIASNAYFYILAPYIRKEFPDIKIVDLLHNEDMFDSSWFGISEEYKNFIIKRIVISEFWKKVLVKKYGEIENKVFVLENAIDTKKYDPSKYNKNLSRAALGLNKNKFIVGFVGRLNYQKNPGVFLELVRAMKENKEFEFIIVGGGDLAKDVINKLKYLSNLKFFGSVKDTAPYISACDLLVCPSMFEGYPLIGLEAAAMNVPVIATDIIGFKEQIQKGKFGLLYRSEKLVSDAENIKQMILDNKSNFSKIGKNGRKFVLKHHNYQKCLNNYQKFMKRLLDKD